MSASVIVRQRGVALVTAMLLLVIITILALSMFRRNATQEMIAGNTREKERALHAATTAQEFGEWWLLQNNNTAAGPMNCVAGMAATATDGQICVQTPQNRFGSVAAMVGGANFPWGVAVTYSPENMVYGSSSPQAQLDPPYFATPGTWITDVGQAADGQGEAYQVDAYGYGSASNTVAVVESVFEVQQGVISRGGL